MSIAINVENVTKTFGETTVLSDITVAFEKGKVHGLIGRNGSGKTMLMKCICGFVPVTRGTITIDGLRLKKDMDFPKNIGVIIEAPGFLPSYNAYRNLKFLADIQGKIGKQEIREAIQKVGLDPDSKKHVGKYSLGMRQRLGLAQAIMEDPDILILDEPMNGLDKDGVAEMRRYLLDLKAAGKTILIASHSAEDIDVLCDTVHEMDKGVLTTIR
ncbi:MAG: ATP-binding cassette domain-containing protein [Lachnospiraceae bacterium]|nr:ATP-binding cassette domain-containing protein [Lachnospiraceae bacterium]